MQIPDYLEQNFQCMLKDTNASRLRTMHSYQIKGSLETRFNHLKNQALQLIQECGDPRGEDMEHTFQSTFSTFDEIGDMSIEWLRANDLPGEWIAVAKIRFQSMAMMHWLLNAPNIFYGGGGHGSYE